MGTNCPAFQPGAGHPGRPPGRRLVASAPSSANNPPMVILEPVTPENYEETLALNVAPDQATFVAPVVKSLADAYVYSGARALVAKEGPTVVGFILLYPDTHAGVPVMNLVRILVDKEHQGRGLGAAILAAAIDEARKCDPRPTKMKLSVVPNNDRAIRLYERLGFAGTELEEGERVMLLPL